MYSLASGVLRNPVINVGAMVANSDIPDWCYSEANLPYSMTKPPLLSPEHYKMMYEASPASVAHHIQSPILLLLGAEDQRVPPSGIF
jgi:acylaminoacyl-peptidase